MREAQIRQWMRKRSAKDSWWYCINGQTSQRTANLDFIRHKAGQSNEPVYIMHEYRARKGKGKWFLYEMPQSPAAAAAPEAAEDSSIRADRPIGAQKSQRKKKSLLQLPIFEPLNAFIIIMIALSVGLLTQMIVSTVQEADTVQSKQVKHRYGLEQPLARPQLSLSIVNHDGLLFISNKQTEPIEMAELTVPSGIVRFSMQSDQTVTVPIAEDVEQVRIVTEGYDPYIYRLP